MMGLMMSNNYFRIDEIKDGDQVQRVAQSLPIYFANTKARSDFVLSDQAGRALEIAEDLRSR